MQHSGAWAFKPKTPYFFHLFIVNIIVILIDILYFSTEAMQRLAELFEVSNVTLWLFVNGAQLKGKNKVKRGQPAAG
jgi:hypothetical protein